MEKNGKPGLLSLFLAFGAAFIVVEAYNAGLREAKKLGESEVPSADTAETDSPSKSQPDDGE